MHRSTIVPNIPYVTEQFQTARYCRPRRPARVVMEALATSAVAGDPGSLPERARQALRPLEPARPACGHRASSPPRLRSQAYGRVVRECDTSASTDAPELRAPASEVLAAMEARVARGPS
jgi:hypothetical protein